MNTRGQPGIERRLTPAPAAPEAPLHAVPSDVNGLPAITGGRAIASSITGRNNNPDSI